MSKPAKQRAVGTAVLPSQVHDDAAAAENGSRPKLARAASQARLQATARASGRRSLIAAAAVFLVLLGVLHLEWNGGGSHRRWLSDKFLGAPENGTSVVRPANAEAKGAAPAVATGGDASQDSLEDGGNDGGNDGGAAAGAGVAEAPYGTNSTADGQGPVALTRARFPMLNYTPPTNVTLFENKMMDELSVHPDTRHRAVLRAVEVWDKSPDECAQALEMPKVAMMFLTKGDLFHHATWRLWFRSARDFLPRLWVHELRCGGDPARLQRVREACVSYKKTTESAYTSPIRQQHLFNVYVHAPPDVKESSLYTLFRGFMVQDRVAPQWGSHQLVEATRYMMWEAYRDPLNERFVLVSESDIPLVNPLVMYNQLMSEELSRINTCKGPRNDRRRWSWRMATDNLQPSHWRKSGQWLSATREHIRVILDDVEVFRQFETHCSSIWDGDYRRWRDCFSDEHYIPTLLASKQLRQDALDCEVWGVCATDWSRGGAHPRSFTMREVSLHLIRSKMRAPTDKCDYDAAWQQSTTTFVKIDSMWDEQCDVEVPAYTKMDLICKLTARKFPKSTRGAVLNKIMKNCESDLHIINQDVCSLAKGSRGLKSHDEDDLLLDAEGLD